MTARYAAVILFSLAVLTGPEALPPICAAAILGPVARGRLAPKAERPWESRKERFAVRSGAWRPK